MLWGRVQIPSKGDTPGVGFKVHFAFGWFVSGSCFLRTSNLNFSMRSSNFKGVRVFYTSCHRGSFTAEVQVEISGRGFSWKHIRQSNRVCFCLFVNIYVLKTYSSTYSARTSTSSKTKTRVIWEIYHKSKSSNDRSFSCPVICTDINS